jgi:hypothetical protein
MSYVLFLDDERLPDQVTWAEFPRYDTIFIIRTYDGFVRQVEFQGLPKFVCFDHDLADEHYAVMEEENSYTYDDGDMKKTFDYGTEKTGYDCAKWLVDYCAERGLKFPRYVVHSMNPAGKERIQGYIENAKKHLGI